MLVFLSDLHLTDGSSEATSDSDGSGRTVTDEFRAFFGLLRNIIGKPRITKISDVTIVFLGDIFDIIRSDIWLRKQNNMSKPVRPWSMETDSDEANWVLENYVSEILDKIIAHNRSVTYCLEEFQHREYKHGVSVRFFYLIGNHDRLINNYASTRKKAADFLRLENPHAQGLFLCSQPFKDYHVTARHGDCYDILNFNCKKPDGPSLGDAIVIDLLTRFQETIERELEGGKNQTLVCKMREIDNVRPLIDIPRWIHGACNFDCSNERKVLEIWERIADEFFDIEFVKKYEPLGWNKTYSPKAVLKFFLLKSALKLSSELPLTAITKVFGNNLFSAYMQSIDGNSFRKCAHEELEKSEYQYVVYGHTHRVDHVPLGISYVQQKDLVEKVYVNTGTWRKVYELTAFNKRKNEFVGWQVMCFVVFYLENEKERDKKYEVWSASINYSDKNRISA